jgi:3-keto-disaccharide hydrolase
MSHLTAPAALLALTSLALAAHSKPIQPFNGKDLTGWHLKDSKKSKWAVGASSVSDENSKTIGLKKSSGSDLINFTTGGGTDIFTEQKFGDIHLELEFMVPKGSNSGVYLMGEYEVQILDSYGKPDDKLTQGDLGALYSAAAPKKNAAKKPGEWQKFVIDFQAPKFEGGKKVANAKFIKVVLNDVVLHENVEMKQHTPGGLTGKEAPEGPLMFQGDHGPVAFRNITITPRK